MKSAKTILCAEDDEHYAELLRCSLRYAGLDHQFQHVWDGAEAMAYLKGEGKFSDRAEYPLPDLVLADLKMPRVNGFELLEWIRTRSDFPHLPVVMLTLSDEIRDVTSAYSRGANSFLMKPPQVEDLREMIKMIDQYWFKMNRVQ